MTPRSYTTDDLPVVHSLYEAAVADVPHCWPVSAEVMAQPLTSDALEREATRLAAQVIFVCGSTPADGGFIHVAREDVNPYGDVRGVIRFFAYPRGRSDIGRSLLEAGESWLRDAGHKRIVAWPQPWKYPHYAFPHAYVSDRLDHVQALLRVAGYTKTGGEIFLDWDHMDPPAPDQSAVGATIELVESAGAIDGRPNLTARALLDGVSVGQCLLIGAGAYHERAADTVFCNALDVDEAHQGQRLGLQLLLTTLRAALDHGYQHGAISTAFNNDRAFLFYANHGFRVSDWTYELSKNER